MEYNSDFKFDLSVGILKEQALGNILNNKTVEVKTDFQATETGNVFIEYSSRNKPSGISTSQADYYCIVFEDSFHFIETSKLKLKCRKYLKTKRDVLGGDSNTSKGILLPIVELL